MDKDKDRTSLSTPEQLSTASDPQKRLEVRRSLLNRPSCPSDDPLGQGLGKELLYDTVDAEINPSSPPLAAENLELSMVELSLGLEYYFNTGFTCCRESCLSHFCQLSLSFNSTSSFFLQQK